MCGICQVRRTHLERHVLRQHRTEPSIQELLTMPKLQYDEAWRSLRDHWQSNAKKEDGRVLCNCGLKIKPVCLKVHLQNSCPSKPSHVKQGYKRLTMNRDVGHLPVRVAKLFNGKQQDPIFYTGAADPTIIEAVHIELESSSQPDENKIMGKFRLMSKYLHAFQTMTSTKISASDMCDLKYYEQLKSMGQGKTDVIDAEKSWKTLPASLGRIATVAIKVLRERNGSKQTIRRLEDFNNHVTKWWYLVRNIVLNIMSSVYFLGLGYYFAVYEFAGYRISCKN